MKMVIILMVALVALNGASAQQISWEEPQQSFYGGVGLNPCAEYLRQQCSPVAAPYFIRRWQMWQPSICQLLRQQCCMQLRQMEPQARCQAMCAVVQFVVQQQQQQQQQGALYEPQLPAAQSPIAVAQMAQNLPAMCGLYQLPSYCTTPCAISAISAIGGHY
ncbi:prolamin PPROL 17D-like [Phragmites australis]|uniref:prolamin PPROL 17D-like n=1 Tax=Phragmites australis TaxID=29695 RepID=UPI002D778636|nr:prolamin PPROL 17D-like [Phragmites australis]